MSLSGTTQKVKEHYSARQHVVIWLGLVVHLLFFLFLIIFGIDEIVFFTGFLIILCAALYAGCQKTGLIVSLLCLMPAFIMIVFIWLALFPPRFGS